MTDPVFRHEALQALRGPEQLGQTLRLVRPTAATALAALACVIIGAFVAAAFIRVPITVQGMAVLMSSQGMLELTVASQHEGRVAELLVEDNDYVTPGQEVARLVQPALESELRLAENEREGIKRELVHVRALQDKVLNAVVSLHQRQREEVEESIELLTERFKALEELARHHEQLRKTGNITIDRLLHTRADLADVRERLAQRRKALTAILVDQSEKQGQYEREIQQLESRLAATERQIARLLDRRKQETVVLSDHAGTVSEIKVTPGDLVRFDTPIVSLLPIDPDTGNDRTGQHRLVAAAFLNARDGKKVVPGMKVFIEPTSVRRDVYGAIEGRIASTSDVPVTPERLRRLLRNDDLVRKVTAEGAPFLAIVELDRNPATPSGYQWTSSRGPDLKMTIGTPSYSDVMVERVPLLALAIPALKEILRGPSQAKAAL